MAFKRLYVYNGAVYYFCVHDEMFSEDERLDEAGNKLVLLLSPFGQHIFTMSFDSYYDRWLPLGNVVSLVPKSFLEMVANTICSRNM